ncbi:MAG TPA: alcohol dehydrogenase catalytic domain-containing protein [Thermodesulfovibrionales bacterium]|nr:alcohol dehydrogenase catalytic domain-containing protein [Thermodesulfovibrionales bacterium]
MKAICVREFGPPEVMKVDELEDPKPGFAEVVVKIYAAGVNPVDTYLRSGSYSPGPVLPYIPGMDGAGVIEAAGEGVESLRGGQGIRGWDIERDLCGKGALQRIPGASSAGQDQL